MLYVLPQQIYTLPPGGGSLLDLDKLTGRIRLVSTCSLDIPSVWTDFTAFSTFSAAPTLFVFN